MSLLLLLNQAAAAGPPDTMLVGSIDTAESVGPPELVGPLVIPADTITSGEVVPGPTLALTLTVPVGTIASGELVPGPDQPFPALIAVASIASATGIMVGPVMHSPPLPDTFVPRIRAGAYDRDGNLIVDLDQSYGRQWQDPLNDTGSGKVVLQADDPDAAAVPYGSIVRFTLDDQARFAVVVEHKERATIAAGEEAEETVTISGRGTLAVFEEAVVAPAGGTDKAVFSDTRAFNFASLETDDSSWGVAVASPITTVVDSSFRFPAAIDACLAPGGGVWATATDGGVGAYGADFYGSLGGIHLNRPVVAIAPKDPYGYWLAASDGGVFAFGSAAFYGGLVGTVLNGPIIAIEATPSGLGYFLIATDGGIFAFGDAISPGASPGAPASGQPTDACLAPGGGVWVVASDGGVFSYGATFYGSMGGVALNAPMVAIVPHGSTGYWLVGADTGIFAFGSAPVRGGYAGMIATEYAAGDRAIVAAELYGPDNLILIADDGATYIGA